MFKFECATLFVQVGLGEAAVPWRHRAESRLLALATLASPGSDCHRLPIVRGAVGAVAAVDKTAERDSTDDDSVFDDIPAKIAQVVKEAVAEHRREGRLIPV